ncbi:hypothetical protein Pfo_015619 [Paulownia fortunei]|nr:hypothetical protein Pfo_015619 [Paulownia fortunei]
MNKYIVSIFILMPLVLQTVASQKHKCSFLLRHIEVRVVNNLPQKSPPLLLHCASKNDDLGYRTLPINKDFHFEFCSNFFNTLFFCHLWWGKKSIVFDAYNVNWKGNRCTDGECYWAAKSDGIYFSGYYPPKNLTKRLFWE